MRDSAPKSRSKKEERLLFRETARRMENPILEALSNVSSETKRKVGPIARIIAESLDK